MDIRDLKMKAKPEVNQVELEESKPALSVVPQVTWETVAEVPQSDYLPILEPYVINRYSATPEVAFRAVALYKRPLADIYAWALARWAALDNPVSGAGNQPAQMESMARAALMEKFPTPADMARALGSSLADLPDAKAWQYARFAAKSDVMTRLLNLL